MTVTFDWLEDDDGDNQESGGLDAYIDVDGSGISFSGDQISSTNFDGGIPKAQPTNTQVRYVVPGNYVFWNISTNTPMTVSIGADVDGEDDGSDTTYDSNLYLVLDVEYDDANDPDGNSTTATRYLYLQDEDESVKVSATGGTTVTIIGNSDPSEWDAGTNGWLLTSDGNAIFSNVLVRGTIDASTIQGSLFKTIDSNDTVATEIPTSGTITFRGIKLDGTKSDSYITIDTEDGDVGSAADNAGLNIFSAGGKRVSIDANEMQATTDNSPTAFSINLFGGNITLGATSSTVSVPGTLSAGSFSPTTLTTSGLLRSTGKLRVDQVDDVDLGASSDWTFLIGSPTGAGLRMDVNEIQATATGTSAAELFIQNLGGDLTLANTSATVTLRGAVFNNNANTYQYGDFLIGGVFRTITGFIGWGNGLNSGAFYPATTSVRDLGLTTLLWKDLYRSGSTYSTSDLRLKTSVQNSDLGLDFIKSLNPVKYKWNGIKEQSGEEENDIIIREGLRYHYGFIAQELKSSFSSFVDDFGGWALSDKNDPDSTQMVVYEELISPIVKAIQELSNKVDSLENRLAILEG